MPKGVSLAAPTAFRNDWFVHEAPQPHWFFDGVTWLGARLGLLPQAYLLWWLLSLAAFGLGAAWLTRRLLPGRAWPAVLLGPVLVAGSIMTMGTSGPLLGNALPHMLGGCLAFAALASLLNGFWRATALLSLLTGLVHVQHGANLVPILIGAALLGTSLHRRARLTLAGTAVLLLSGSVAVTYLRQINSVGDEWLEVCEQAAPFHCDANSWTVTYLLSGILVVALALGLCVAYRRSWRTIGPAVALPALGSLIAVLSDRFDVPALGQLAQQTNAYRLTTLVMPFAAFALIVLAVAADSPGRRRTLPLAVLIACLTLWMAAPDAPFGRAKADGLLVLLLAMTAIVTASLVKLARSAARWPRPQLPVAVIAILVAMILATGNVGRRTLSFDRRDAVTAASLSLQSRVPEGSVIAVAPGLAWIGPISQRAVIADCKRVPYGGALWTEYKERMTALGGRDCKPTGEGFRKLTIEQVLSLRDRYGATHLLLRGDDPKLGQAKGLWTLTAHLPVADDPRIDAGWWVFELPAA
jgi:hypothetical protein